MKTITIKLKSDDNHDLKILIASKLARKPVVSQHTYETPLGLFTVKVGKTIIVEER